MPNFEQLWPTRLRQHLRQQNRYLRYVFNDNLLLALIFIVGALAYWYQKQLQLISQPVVWANLVLILVLGLSICIGHYASLLTTADQVFLMPREAQLKSYLLRARRYSMILPTLFVAVLGFILTPFVLRATHLTLTQWLILILGTWLFKDASMRWQMLVQVHDDRRQKQVWSVILILSLLTSLTISLYGKMAWLYLLVGLVVDGWLWQLLEQQLNQKQIAWLALITAENNRQRRLLQFYNLFVDVPGVGGQIRQRRYLQGLISWWSAKQDNVDGRLYLQAFVRRSDYSYIWLRFVIFGAVLLALIAQIWLLGVLALLFIYLTGYQLLPLYHHFDNNALYRLYPRLGKSRQQAFFHILAPLLALEWLLQSVVLLIHLRGQVWAWLICLGGLGLIKWLVTSHLPNKLRKNKKER